MKEESGETLQGPLGTPPRVLLPWTGLGGLRLILAGLQFRLKDELLSVAPSPFLSY